MVFAASLLGLLRTLVITVGAQTTFFFILLDFGLIIAALSISMRFGTGDKAAEGRAPQIGVKLIIVGVVLIAVAWLSIFTIVNGLPIEERSLPFFSFISLTVLGLIIVGAGGVIRSIEYQTIVSAVPVTPRIISLMREVEPDKSFGTTNFLVYKKGRIYILMRKMFIGTHFVKMLEETPVDTRQVRIPFARWGVWHKRSFNYEIDDFRVARVEGNFTIPADTVRHGNETVEKYVKGLGVLYFLDNSYYLNKPKITRILESLAREPHKK
jgi:uncharacterized membrane protein YidH (DUF202 family)